MEKNFLTQSVESNNIQLECCQLSTDLNTKVLPVFRELNIPLTAERVMKYCVVGGTKALLDDYPNARSVLTKYRNFPKYSIMGREKDLIYHIKGNIQKRCFEPDEESLKRNVINNDSIKRSI